MGNVCGNTRRQVELEAKQEESRGNSEQPPSITPLKSPALKKSKSALLLLSPVALFSPRNHGNEEEVLDVEISDELLHSPQDHAGVVDWSNDNVRSIVANADEFASNISSTTSWTIQSLSDHLLRSVSQAYSIFEKHLYLSRCVVRWIFSNIKYDEEGESRGEYTKNSSRANIASSCISSKKSDRFGLAVLLFMLLEKMDTPVVIINGWINPCVGVNYSTTTHTWNAICIDQSWYLVDMFSLISNEDNNDLSSRFFLPTPEEFVLDHLPEQREWQLLKNPVNKEDFAKMATFEKEFDEMGFRMLDNRFSRFYITCTNQISIPFEVSSEEVIEGAIVVGELTPIDHEYPSWLEDRSFIMFRKDVSKRQVVLDCTLPYVGKFNLTVFGGNKKQDGGFYLHKFVDYQIESTTPIDVNEDNYQQHCLGYPRVFRSYDPNLETLIAPSIAYFKFDKPIEFKLWSARAEQMVLVNDKNWYEFKKEPIENGSHFSLSLPQGLTPASTKIYSCQPSSMIFVPILEYPHEGRESTQMSSNCFRYGVYIYDIRVVLDECTIEFRTRSEMDINCNLVLLEEGGETIVNEQQMKTTRTDDKVNIQIQFPKPGVYIFDCIGKTSTIFPLFTVTLECLHRK